MSTTTSIRLRRQIDTSGDCPTVTSEDIRELDAEMSGILERMAVRTTYEDAKPELDELADLHGLLATLLFKWCVDLTDRQRQVVRSFDRWDDEDTRKHFFGEVTAGRM